MRRAIIPLIFGLAGAAILVWLGTWQLQRLAWKEGVLAEIDARIADTPTSIPAAPHPEQDKYLPVRASGHVGAETLRVLVSRKQIGAGYRLISAFDTGSRRVLLDRGFIPVTASEPEQPDTAVEVLGNLHWPDDRNASTPENDIENNVWFARDIGQMARQLGTEPVLLVLREMTPAEPGLVPLPTDTQSITNDHREYAITWFSLALVWAAMTGYFIWRQIWPQKGDKT